MSDLNIQLCPETGICSIVKLDGAKVDLMPDEVVGLREASGDSDAIRQAVAAIDSGFAEALALEQLDQISKEIS